jgi:hypothetical protein
MATGVLMITLAAVQAAADSVEVGRIAAIRGSVTIHRNGTSLPGTPNERILISDTVETMDNSRVKIRFLDDSVITLSRKTVFRVEEYMHGTRNERGLSVFRLLDGKIKTLVGGNEFEVHTPTAVAAARGTYFFVWVRTENGMLLTDVACLEGTVEVSNVDPRLPGVVAVATGKVSTVAQQKLPTPPRDIPKALLKDLLNCRRVDRKTLQ